MAWSVWEPVKHVAMEMKEAQVAPGQLITHYAPYCDTFLVCCKWVCCWVGGGGSEGDDAGNRTREDWKHGGAGFWRDVGRLSRALLEVFVAVGEVGMMRTMHCRGDVMEAMKNIYGKLREAERVEGVKLILLASLGQRKEELALSVMDRMVRATSGKMIKIPPHFEWFNIVCWKKGGGNGCCGWWAKNTRRKRRVLILFSGSVTVDIIIIIE